MGYDTAYDLSVSAPPGWAPLSKAYIDQIAERLEPMDFDINECQNGTALSASSYCHWYEHDDDMIELSKLFPDALFELYGDGEESDDFWRYYYYRGVMQGGAGEIVYPPLDFAALQNEAADLENEEAGPSDFTGGDLSALMGIGIDTK